MFVTPTTQTNHNTINTNFIKKNKLINLQNGLQIPPLHAFFNYTTPLLPIYTKCLFVEGYKQANDGVIAKKSCVSYVIFLEASFNVLVHIFDLVCLGVSLDCGSRC
jgi:hypothetical protein